MKKTSFPASPALTLGLAFLAPVFFIFSTNWHMFGASVMLVASGLAFLAAVLIVLLASFAVRFWERAASTRPRWLRYLVAAAFCLLLVTICSFFFQELSHAAIPEPRWLRILLSWILPFIILLLLVKTIGLKPVNFFLLIFLGFSLVNMGKGLLDGEEPGSGASLPLYELKERPNIYLYFLESYHSLDIQRNVYGIDSKDFEDYLSANNFVDYGKIYSNSSTTLLSFADTFSLTHNWMHARGNQDAVSYIRSMLSGGGHNTLFKILKQNAYTTIMLAQDPSYYGSSRRELLDDSDVISADQRYALLSEVIGCYEMLNSRFREPKGPLGIRRHFDLSQRLSQRYSGGLEARVRTAMSVHGQKAEPFFLAFKGGAQHSPSNGTYDWREHEQWVASGKYQKAIAKGNRELKRICDEIIARDPGGLVILIGDHGAWRFRDAELGGFSFSSRNWMKQVKKKGLSFVDFCEDRHAVFLAIRLPHGRQTDISRGLVMSHVNLFRHIFAHLNDDPGILENREPSVSYFKDQIIITEGKVLDEP